MERVSGQLEEASLHLNTYEVIVIQLRYTQLPPGSSRDLSAPTCISSSGAHNPSPSPSHQRRTQPLARTRPVVLVGRRAADPISSSSPQPPISLLPFPPSASSNLVLQHSIDSSSTQSLSIPILLASCTILLVTTRFLLTRLGSISIGIANDNCKVFAESFAAWLIPKPMFLISGKSYVPISSSDYILLPDIVKNQLQQYLHIDQPT
ncbi:hypothetical protein EV127DRAFT_413175 [Xylaria flabelliformis]|nr:hypothetical protein EV127DRAFT_413175 [Xylaria flabelliformis]